MIRQSTTRVAGYDLLVCTVVILHLDETRRRYLVPSLLAVAIGHIWDVAREHRCRCHTVSNSTRVVGKELWLPRSARSRIPHEYNMYYTENTIED